MASGSSDEVLFPYIRTSILFSCPSPRSRNLRKPEEASEQTRIKCCSSCVLDVPLGQIGEGLWAMVEVAGDIGEM